MWREGEILVAEDSKLLLQLLHDALTAHGLGTRVVPCRDGERLIEELLARCEGQGQVALYLLDIIMPGMSGIDLARRIRAIEQEHDITPTPILLYSTREQDAEIEAVVEECWPARFVRKEAGARADQLAITVIRILEETREQKTV